MPAAFHGAGILILMQYGFRDHAEQTRVETVIPYFHKWMLAFPDIRSLAEAEEDRY
jgi:hypothetical protein